MTPFLEQAAAFNSYNSQIDVICAENTTVSAFAIGTLWCPSDGSIVGLRHDFSESDCFTNDCSPLTTTYSSYAGNTGTWAYRPGLSDALFVPKLGRMNGVFSYLGFPSWTSQVDGVRNPGSIDPVRLRDITDGTSTTIAFGERAHGRLDRTGDAPDFYYWNLWCSPAYGDTLFTTFYPINPGRALASMSIPGDASPPGATAYVLAASSFHPGGAELRLRGRLGALPQGHHRLLVARPSVRGADRRHPRRPGLLHPRPGLGEGLPGPLDSERRGSDR